MTPDLTPLVKTRLADRGLFNLLITAAFIAIVSFGAIGGVLAVFFPRFLFGLSAGVTCPRGALVYDEWYDGEATQFRVNCVDSVTGQSSDRTLLSLLFLLGGDFIVIFWIVFVILLILRAVQKKKQGV